jgi:hypothetical protein
MNKWIRVMADFDSDGFWEEDGSMMERENIPISLNLMVRHIKWCEWFEKYDFDVVDFDIKGFSKEGSEIAFAIKDELPDWTVIYFNQELAVRYPTGPRHMFEYEVGTEQ